MRDLKWFNEVQTDVILLDFSNCKAFDRVTHMRLCHKLHHLGINGSLNVYYLNEHRESLRVNGERS